MSQPNYFGPDPGQTRLRTSMWALDRRIRHVSEIGLDTESARLLRESFDDLASQLALGPEPLTRQCPKCRTIGMRNATVCGNCWTHLDALPDEDADAA